MAFKPNKSQGRRQNLGQAREARHNERSDEVKKLADELAKVRAACDSWREQVDRMRETNRTLRSTLAETEETVSILVQERKDNKRRHRNQVRRLRRKVAQADAMVSADEVEANILVVEFTDESLQEDPDYAISTELEDTDDDDESSSDGSTDIDEVAALRGPVPHAAGDVPAAKGSGAAAARTNNVTLLNVSNKKKVIWTSSLRQHRARL